MRKTSVAPGHLIYIVDGNHFIGYTMSELKIKSVDWEELLIEKSTGSIHRD